MTPPYKKAFLKTNVVSLVKKGARLSHIKDPNMSQISQERGYIHARSPYVMHTLPFHCLKNMVKYFCVSRIWHSLIQWPHSCLIPIYNAFFYQEWPPYFFSLSWHGKGTTVVTLNKKNTLYIGIRSMMGIPIPIRRFLILDALILIHLGPLLLTWFNFNPSMDK